MLQAIEKQYRKTQLSVELDQAVALIFKNIQNQPLSILYLQRNYQENDRYSGDLCFPGGHIEKGETPMDAAIRQTWEEAAINLNEKGRFLGMMKRPFLTKVEEKANNKTKRYHMGVLLFEIKEEVEIKLSEKEMRDYKWVPFEKFTNGSVTDLCYHDRNLKNILKLKSEKAISWIHHPALNIGMEKVLWGLTFLITGILIAEILIFYGISRLRQEGILVNEKYLQEREKHGFSVKIRYETGEEEEKQFESSRKQFLEMRARIPKPKL